MKVIELLEALSDLPEDAEVMLASQPAWPFEYTLGEPVVVEYDDGAPTVYLPEGQQVRYLPGAAARELGGGASERRRLPPGVHP